MAVGDKLPVVMGREKAAPEGVATLDENGILAEAQRPNLAQVGGSNPNLLRNWDFRNPVNRNGQTEYIGSGSTIDQWFIRNDSSLKLHQNAVVFTNTSINDNWFYQKFEQVWVTAPHLRQIWPLGLCQDTIFVQGGHAIRCGLFPAHDHRELISYRHYSASSNFSVPLSTTSS